MRCYSVNSAALNRTDCELTVKMAHDDDYAGGQKKSCSQKCDDFMKSIWNSDKKEFIGRTGSSWGRFSYFHYVPIICYRCQSIRCQSCSPPGRWNALDGLTKDNRQVIVFGFMVVFLIYPYYEKLLT